MRLPENDGHFFVNLVDGLLKPVLRKKRRQDTQSEKPPTYSFVSPHAAIQEDNRELERGGNDDYICSRCQAIDFDLAFKSRISDQDYYGRSIIELGRFDEVLKTSRCRLCRLFLDLRPESPGPFDLYAFSSSVFDAEPWIHFSQPKVPGLEDSVFLAVIKNGDNRVDIIRHETLRKLRETGFICQLQEQHSSPSTICVRLLRSESADFDLIKEWLSFCQNHHRGRCALKNSTPVPGLKFIDCSTRQIVMATKGMEYLALSYVWGLGLTSGDDEFSGSSLPDNILQTISDALAVTIKLQYRYLWIDRYCITQNSAEEKHAQISLMGSIYRNAEATIVAAAGGDPTYGLPGAGYRSRNSQQRVSIGQQILCSTRPDPKFVIERSTWMSRGWTYQEAFLSRRLIFFTEDQVYFECQTMHCREAISPPLRLVHTKNKRRLHEGFHPGMFRQIEQEISCESVWRIIAAYSRRSMSFDDDALGGILGLLTYLENCKHRVYHFWGVPIFTPALWIKRKRNAMLPRGKLVHAFANALLWHHQRPARRRPGFPSWSWTGWDGSLQSSNLPEFYRNSSYYSCHCRKQCEQEILKVFILFMNIYE
jgi:uncharacterized protein YcfL